jgi:hypothetical protein
MAFTTEEETQLRALLALPRTGLPALPAVVTPAAEDLLLMRQGALDKHATLAQIAAFAAATVTIPDIPPAPGAGSTTEAGLLELATAAEALAGTDATLAISPAVLASLFTHNKAATGHLKIFDFIINWGSVTVAANGNALLTFDEPFPTACVAAFSTPIGQNAGGGNEDWWGVDGVGLASLTVYSKADALRAGYVLAIGY